MGPLRVVPLTALLFEKLEFWKLMQKYTTLTKIHFRGGKNKVANNEQKLFSIRNV